MFAKKMLVAGLVSAAVTLGGGAFTPVYADNHSAARKRDPGVNKRQNNQRQRINQGVRGGELTRDEARTLREEQRDVRKLEREYKSDGTLTRAERRDLHREQNEASQNIREEKHNSERR